MFELLKVSPEKISDKFIASVYERVTSLARELKKRPSFEEARDAMCAGFADFLGASFEEGDLMPEEINLAEELKAKYASKEWLMKR